jgi:hypothetical protein
VTTSEHYMHLDQDELADAMRRAQRPVEET